MAMRTLLAASSALVFLALPTQAQQSPVDPVMFSGGYEPLQPLGEVAGPAQLEGHSEGYYVPSTPETVMWGYLPNRGSEPVMTVPSGSIVTFDTLSHEGLLEDQGRDPEAYFAGFEVARDFVLDDAIEVTDSDIAHDFAADGPHIVTGPIEIEGAQPGDILKIETLSIIPRTGYGVISNRHGKGALPGEFPETPEPTADASAESPEAYNNVSIFTPISERDGQYFGALHTAEGEMVEFPIRPFMGLMGVAPDTSEPVHSVPPAIYGGNLDINELGAGSTLYLPVEVAGALFYTGDPHAAQGDGEVALTALEHSMRPTFRLTVLKPGDEGLPISGDVAHPMAETGDYWIAIGLNEDLDEAMKEAVRQAIGLLTGRYQMDRATALAYLSAGVDFEVSQVVDKTKGVHALIPKADFSALAVD